MPFTIRDFPGGFEFTHMNSYERSYFQNCSILIFVMDAQDEPYNTAVRKCALIMREANKINNKILFKVFIHKADGDLFMSDNLKLEVQRNIMIQLKNELQESDLLEP